MGRGHKRVLSALDGIVYGTYPPNGDSEVRVVAPGGGASRTLFTTGALQRIGVVAP